MTVWWSNWDSIKADHQSQNCLSHVSTCLRSSRRTIPDKGQRRNRTEREKAETYQLTTCHRVPWQGVNLVTHVGPNPAWNTTTCSGRNLMLDQNAQSGNRTYGVFSHSMDLGGVDYRMSPERTEGFTEQCGPKVQKSWWWHHSWMYWGIMTTVLTYNVCSTSFNSFHDIRSFTKTLLVKSDGFLTREMLD